MFFKSYLYPAFFLNVFSNSYLLPVLHFTEFHDFRKPSHWVWCKLTALFVCFEILKSRKQS